MSSFILLKDKFFLTGQRENKMNKVLLFRALLATKFKYISGINDNFFSTFLFMVNVGFTFGSHFGLFFLGSLGSEQRLIGVRKEQRPLRDYS